VSGMVVEAAPPVGVGGRLELCGESDYWGVGVYCLGADRG
jgi:hypothetical protein